MPRHIIYLEAPERTQDLLNIKWTLRSAGYTIGSSWHDDEASAASVGFKDHWSARSLEQLQTCDSLVVICGKTDGVALEVSMMAGFALARGLRVIWIGDAVRGLSDFRSVQRFDTADDFLKQILLMHPQPTLEAEPLAA
ncbi:MAG: hypothetical protein WBW33_04185 [Bryobacteraceae bacterium]